MLVSYYIFRFGLTVAMPSTRGSILETCVVIQYTLLHLSQVSQMVRCFLCHGSPSSHKAIIPGILVLKQNLNMVWWHLI